jgi:uncharacterized membrane protein
MNKKYQWQVDIIINAPLKRVWDAVEDLSLIPKYHPEVRTVEYVSGQTRRAEGVSYKCIVPKGRKGWCIERVVEHIPYEKTTIDFPEDSWGLSRMFSDFVTEINVKSGENDSTIATLVAFYNPKGALTAVMNALFIRRMMRKRALQTLASFKKLVEKQD